MLDKKIVERHIKDGRNHLETNPHRDNNKVDIAMLEVIGEMALINMVPDGTFSDNECVAWEIFRRIIDKVNT